MLLALLLPVGLFSFCLVSLQEAGGCAAARVIQYFFRFTGVEDVTSNEDIHRSSFLALCARESRSNLALAACLSARRSALRALVQRYILGAWNNGR